MTRPGKQCRQRLLFVFALLMLLHLRPAKMSYRDAKYLEGSFLFFKPECPIHFYIGSINLLEVLLSFTLDPLFVCFFTR